MMRWLAVLATLFCLAATPAAALGNRLRLVYIAPPSPLPATQTVHFGVKTLVGFGGSPMGYANPQNLGFTRFLCITSQTDASAASVSLLTIDERSMLVPKNGAGAYGTTWGAPANGPYTVNAEESYTACGTNNATATPTGNTTIITVVIDAATATIREMTSAARGCNSNVMVCATLHPDGGTGAFSATTHQMNSMISGAGLLVLGDTIKGRDGTFNPTGLTYRTRPPASIGAGSGPLIIITSENTYSGQVDAKGNPVRGGGFFVGNMAFDPATAGDTFYPYKFNWISFYFSYPNGGTTLLGYTGSSGYGVSVYNSRFEIGPLTPAAKAVTLTAFVARGGVMDSNYVKNVGRGVTGGILDGLTTTITNNIFDGMQSDGMTLNGNNLLVTDNFLFNFKFYTGEHPDAIQHLGYANGLTVANFGSFLRNIAVRNVAVSGHGDAQGLFFDNETPLTRIGGADVENNILLLTAANGIAPSRFNVPVVNDNTVLTDFQVSSGGTLTMSITVPTSKGGTDGTFQRNLTTGLSVAPQGGTVTTTFTTVLAKTLLAYTGALPAYTNTNLDTRAAVIAAMTPSSTGTAKNADGTISGALLPTNDFNETCWNPGTVWDHTAHCTPAQ